MYFFFLIDLLIKIIFYTYFFTGCYENKRLNKESFPESHLTQLL